MIVRFVSRNNGVLVSVKIKVKVSLDLGVDSGLWWAQIPMLYDTEVLTIDRINCGTAMDLSCEQTRITYVSCSPT